MSYWEKNDYEVMSDHRKSNMSSAMPSILDDQFCYENGVLIVTTGYYRFSLSFSLVISIISATYLIYFFHRHYRNLSFHWNIKVLLFSLYLCCFLYACLNIFMKVHYLLLPFLLSTPCQIFLPLIVYLCTHLPVIFILFISQYIQIAMIFERCVATISVQNYEYGYRKLAVMLLVAAVIATLATMLVLYQGERFDGLYLNGRMLPLGTYKVANLVIIVLLCVNFVGLVSAIVLHFINRKRRIRTTLSSKFQTLENRVTSDLLFWVSSIQFATFVLTDIATLIVRIFLPGSRFATAFKENADLFNIYSLFLPILTTTYLTKVKKRRITDIRNNVNMKSNGNEGWRNYSAVTHDRWI
ncbi:hypothetical protein Y032_0261g560 [Ancylostoma ceylanicum]|uniref:Serpentine receptor class gamma n=1 Tax=Ancylostoma ceylanicum TaxID=53326 RepID=A0A016SAB5_9BILA|nr:hypothetical protein Y032_0261g560 [Ancylostoma ceylanicum]